MKNLKASDFPITHTCKNVVVFGDFIKPIAFVGNGERVTINRGRISGVLFDGHLSDETFFNTPSPKEYGFEDYSLLAQYNPKIDKTLLLWTKF